MTALPVAACPTEAELEFDRQIDALALAGLPDLLDLAERCFRASLEPLRDLLPPPAPDGATIPFVVVTPYLPVLPALEAVQLLGGPGFTTMSADDLARFRPLPGLDVPPGPYLLLDVDTGAGTLDEPPGQVLPRIAAAGRSPLTIPEGLAVLISDPGVLRGRNCFSLAGSRAGDKRVPALWVSARRPRLGWCYQGAPHSWLGTASCGGRAAVGGA
ncbi:MAG: hypothetical protein JWP33_502 [Blastococcus sp.]|jgi:hypothetical protein|nr:hypothetical protein [Blastococcus sp.]